MPAHIQLEGKCSLYCLMEVTGLDHEA